MKLKYNDKAHAYWLDGRRCTGISGLGKQLDDTRGLEDWGKRHVAWGIAMNIDLQNLIVSHWDEADRASKQFCNDVCTKAIEAAKAGAAANTGTAIHRALERSDAGEVTATTPTLAAAIGAYATSLEAAGLVAEPGMSECAVVWPDDAWAGRFDRCFRTAEPCIECGGNLVLADIKTGVRALQYPAPIVVQLAGYALAPLVTATPPGLGDWETTDLEPMPKEVCRCRALIVSIPADAEVGAVHAVDLAVGRRGLELVRAVKAWRSQKELTQPFGPPVDIAGQLAASVAVTSGKVPTRHDLIERIMALPPEAKADLAAAWPEGVATFKASEHHDAGDLAEIHSALKAVESKHRVPFPDAGPAPAVEPLPVGTVWGAAQPRPTYAAEADVAEMVARVVKLDRATLAAVTAAAKAIGVPHLSSGRITPEHLTYLDRLLADPPVEAEL